MTTDETKQSNSSTMTPSTTEISVASQQNVSNTTLTEAETLTTATGNISSEYVTLSSAKNLSGPLITN